MVVFVSKGIRKEMVAVCFAKALHETNYTAVYLDGQHDEPLMVERGITRASVIEIVKRFREAGGYDIQKRRNEYDPARPGTLAAALS